MSVQILVVLHPWPPGVRIAVSCGVLILDHG
jgi:hypothetical protein